MRVGSESRNRQNASCPVVIHVTQNLCAFWAKQSESSCRVGSWTAPSVRDGLRSSLVALILRHVRAPLAVPGAAVSRVKLARSAFLAEGTSCHVTVPSTPGLHHPRSAQPRPLS